jgi:membrane-associated phospholipid phosphatase
VIGEPADAGHPPTGGYLPIARFDRPSPIAFKKQLDYLASYADLRPDRAVEILEQLATPVPFLASIAFLRPDTKRWTLELLAAVFRLAQFVEFRVKHALACRRPDEYSPQIQPIIQTPGHDTLPSGHATESFALALVLWQLLQKSGAKPYSDQSYAVQFMRLANRIAINRTVAGVHFPIDSVAGALLGLTLGDYFLARVAKPIPPDTSRVYMASHFNGTHSSAETTDFLWTDIFKIVDPPDPLDPVNGKVIFGLEIVKPFNITPGGSNSIDLAINDVASPALEWLWDKALAEWTALTPPP